MKKTYLEMVNNILIRLREREVTTITQSAYSKLIGVLVRDAIELVESAWNWSALRTSININTVAGTFNYVLTDAGDKSTILSIINANTKQYVEYQTQEWFNQQYLMNGARSGSPTHYTFNSTDDNGNTQVDLWPKPNAIETLHVNLVQRSPDIAGDATKVNVPYIPVQTLAYAMALEERGEDGGMSAVSAKALAHNYLSDAIAIDAGKHPEELIWEAP